MDTAGLLLARLKLFADSAEFRLERLSPLQKSRVPRHYSFEEAHSLARIDFGRGGTTLDLG
jgi:hypothetical protein